MTSLEVFQFEKLLFFAFVCIKCCLLRKLKRNNPNLDHLVNVNAYSKLSIRSQDIERITITRLYNFDSLKPHFYIVKLGFAGVYIIFSSPEPKAQGGLL